VCPHCGDRDIEHGTWGCGLCHCGVRVVALRVWDVWSLLLEVKLQKKSHKHA
jgi:hypothetical protein